MTTQDWREEFETLFSQDDFESMYDFIQQQINKAEEKGYKQGFIDCGIAYENGIKSALDISNPPQ